MRLRNDYLNIPAPWISFSNGYHVANMEPLTLKDRLENDLGDYELSDEDKTRIQT